MKVLFSILAISPRGIDHLDPFRLQLNVIPMSSREEHAVNIWQSFRLNLKLLTLKVLLHDVLTLSQLAKQYLISTLIDLISQIPPTSISAPQALAAAQKVPDIATQSISRLT